MATKTEHFVLFGETSWEDPKHGKSDPGPERAYRWEDDLADEKGSPSGASAFRSTILASGSIDCEGWLEVGHRGRILVEGELTFPGGEVDKGTLQVTGGTKAFAGASGSVEVSRENPKRYDITLVI
jgi:hypothetical protein